MHIAILVTNTDDSAFAESHPSDGDRFSQLLLTGRPEWRVSVFDLPKGAFPEDLTGYDGFLIGGSPASVHDGFAWNLRLADLIRKVVAARTPLFGACFGHQAIAMALGGSVGPNPGGWVLGMADTTTLAPAPWMEGGPHQLRMCAAHLEQVTTLPQSASLIGGNDTCPIGSFRIGGHVFTTQYHPEMPHDFIAALIEELATDLPPDVITDARASLARPADLDLVQGWIQRFFEMGKAAARA